MEDILVRGAALKDKLARVTIKNTPDKPGVAASLFHAIAASGIVVDDIMQTVSEAKTATVSFTVELKELEETRKVCEKLVGTVLKGAEFSYETNLSKVSVVGVGMRVHTGVAERMFKALADAKVNIQNITTSEIKISCIIDSAEGKQALRLVHDAFDLGTAQPAAKKGAAKAAGKCAKKSCRCK